MHDETTGADVTDATRSVNGMVTALPQRL